MGTDASWFTCAQCGGRTTIVYLPEQLCANCVVMDDFPVSVQSPHMVRTASPSGLQPLLYPVLIEPVVAGGEVVEYSATPPDLPGCVAAGNTPEQAVSAVRVAIEQWVADARHGGLPIPEPSVARRQQPVVTLDELAAEVRRVQRFVAENMGVRVRGTALSDPALDGVAKAIAAAVAEKLGVKVDD
jgi:predicted RNase H-like HicB family nuclease